MRIAQNTSFLTTNELTTEYSSIKYSLPCMYGNEIFWLWSRKNIQNNNCTCLILRSQPSTGRRFPSSSWGAWARQIAKTYLWSYCISAPAADSRSRCALSTDLSKSLTSIESVQGPANVDSDTLITENKYHFLATWNLEPNAYSE